MAFNKAKALQDAEKSVAQGKISQAIKQYAQVYEKDPSDLTLLNTIGDLHIREKNLPEALKYFHKLADSYTQEGFTVKGIAIYKKIAKLDPATVDVLLKMGELYMVQGLGREAREQYAAAVDFYKKKNQNDKALETFHKIVALDPENTAYRLRMADFCEQVGKKAEAVKAYVETAEVALRRDDKASAESALQKASKLDSKNPGALLLRARLALSNQQPGEAEKILDAVPELKAQPAAQQVLLQAYLAAHKLPAAEKLVVDVFAANPGDFSPLASFAGLCMAQGDFDAALAPLAEIADSLIQRQGTGPLMEVLRQLWGKSPQHLPTLELIYKICDSTADEATLPEILEALGHAYVQLGELAKAEACYQKLLNREPENQDYRGMLSQVLQKEGKALGAPSPSELTSAEMALTPEPEIRQATNGVAASSGASSEEAAAVKEALENSDLYSRYGLVDKAIAELEKVLVVYPNQIDIHSRILEVAQKDAPERARQAAAALAMIYSERGDEAGVRKYEHMAGQGAPAAAPQRPAQAPPASRAVKEPPPPADASPPPVAEFDLSAEFPGIESSEAPSPQPEAPLDLSAPPAEEAPAATPEPAVAPGPGAPAFNYEDSTVEVDFYLDQGFVEEAQNAVAALEEKFPGDARVAELRVRLERHAPSQAKPAEAEIEEAAPALAAVPTEPEAPPDLAEVEPQISSPAIEPVLAGAFSEAETAPEPAQAAAGGNPLAGLVGDLEASLEGIESAAPPRASSPAASRQAAPPSPVPQSGTPAGSSPQSAFSGLLAELGEGGEAEAAADDPQTHYDLGVAFREMALLDEAIGEFQKVVKGAQKGKFPPNFLQACTLLATCFMEKKMPAIAAKWYARALELPDLDDEAMLALHYDLGTAYEQAGDTRTALEKYSEVYSQNIDYRDVAEKIRLLQQKA